MRSKNRSLNGRLRRAAAMPAVAVVGGLLASAGPADAGIIP